MKRDAGITVRLSEAERRALNDAALTDDVPVAQIVRRAIRRELERMLPAQPKRKEPRGRGNER